MQGGVLVPVVVTALLAAIAVDAQLITLSSPTQTSDGQFINVTVTAPSTRITTLDVVAVYAASASNFTINPPLKYKPITYTTSGTNSIATISFKTYNIRQNLVFVYVGKASTTAASPVPGFKILGGTVLASATLVNANPFQPTQIRLALASDPTTMTVSWTTGQDPPPQYVEYGTSSGSYSTVLLASQTNTYTANAICGTFASQYSYIDPGLFSSANLTDLTPATKYYYRVGALNTTGGAVSAEYSFVSAPVTGPQTSVNIILSADMSTNGYDDGSNLFPTARQNDSPQNTIVGIANEIQHNGYTMTLMNGDLAYADGYLGVWEIFSSDIQPFTAYSPFMIIDGNHERDWAQSNDAFSPNPGNKSPQGPFGVCPSTTGPWTASNPYYGCDSQGECGSITSARYSFPGVGILTPTEAATSGGSKQKFYSYNYGPIHFVSYSTEESVALGSSQYNFLAADLAAVNRSVTPWVIASGHRPFYADTTDFTGLPDPSLNNTVAPATAGESDGDQYVALNQRTSFEPLFAKYGVDLFYNGHKHTMFRTCAVRFGQCATTRNPDGSIQGTVYLTGGNAGRSLSNAISALLQENPPYAPYANQIYGTGVDPFNLTLGGYYVSAGQAGVPTHQNTYGYQRLFANATHLIVQPMNVTNLPATPFLDDAARFVLTRIPLATTAPPTTTSSPPGSTPAPPTSSPAPPATNRPGLKQQIDAALGIPQLDNGKLTGLLGLPFEAEVPAPAPAVGAGAVPSP